MQRTEITRCGVTDIALSRLPRVLYLTKVHPYPPATAGDAVYSRGIIEALGTTCKVTVLCSDSGATQPADAAIDWCVTTPRRVGRAGSVLSSLPLIAWKGATPAYLAALDKLLKENWDAIVLDNLGLVHALPKAEKYRCNHPNTKLIYVSHEYEYPTREAKYKSYQLSPLKRLMITRDLAKVKRSEVNLITRCDIVTVINTSDLAPFRNISAERKYLPLTPGYNGPVVKHRVISADTPRRVLILGGRRSEQKQQILLDWMEIAYAPLTEAGIELVVVGDMDSALLKKLQHTWPNVQALGFVDDLEALIASARLGLIADTVGGGFKMRLLSHVFERLPIVGLEDAIDGLPTKKGEGYLGAPNLQTLVDLVGEVIDDTERLNALQNKAFQDCVSEYSWQTRAQNFARSIQDCSNELLV